MASEGIIIEVPEVASRAHVELIVPVVAESMVAAGAEGSDLDGVAATAGVPEQDVARDGEEPVARKAVAWWLHRL